MSSDFMINHLTGNLKFSIVKVYKPITFCSKPLLCVGNYKCGGLNFLQCSQSQIDKASITGTVMTSK
jgi:hypothetical protein